MDAHSQGAETVYNLSYNLRKMMEAIAFGPARILQTTNFRKAQNYIAHLDYVTAVADPMGLARGLSNGNTAIIKTMGNPLKSHFWDESTYASIYSYMGKQFAQNHGL